MKCKLFYNGMFFENKESLAKYLSTKNFILSEAGDVANVFDISTPRLAAIRKNFTSPRVYNEAKHLFVDYIDRAMNPTSPIVENKKGQLINVPLTRGEAINLTYRTLKRLQRDIQEDVDNEIPISDEDGTTLQALNDMLPIEVFNQMVKNIYPTISFHKNADGKYTYRDGNLEFSYEKDSEDDFSNNFEETDYTSEEQTASSLRGSVGASQYHETEDTINPLRKVSLAVKEFMSTIFTHNGENHVRPGRVYTTMLNTISGIKDGDEIEQLRKNFEKHGMIEGDESNAEYAIFRKLENLLKNAQRQEYLDGSPLPTGYSFVWVGDNQKGHYEFHNMNTQEIVTLSPLMSTSDKFKAVKENSGLDYETIRLLYQKQESAESLASIYFVVNSLRDANPAFCNYSIRFAHLEGKSERYQDAHLDFYRNESRLGPIKNSLKSIIVTNYKEMLRQRQKIDNLSETPSSSDPSVRKKLNNYLVATQIFQTPIDMSDAVVDDLVSDLIGLLDDLKQVGAKKELTPEGIQLRYTPDDILKDSKGRLNNLAEVVSAHYRGDQRASSYVSGDGKQKWFHRNSSTGHETLRSFVTRVNKPLFTIQPYYQYNPFVRGTSTIHDIIDHDSIFESSKSLYAPPPVTYTQEDEVYWKSRNFLYNFCAFVGGHTKLGVHYLQQVYTVSNKTQIPEARINVLNDDELRNAIKQAILQEANRPETPLVQALKVFKRDKSFLGVKATPQELAKDIDTSVEMIMRKRSKEAREALEKFIDANPVLNNSIESAYKILKNNDFFGKQKAEKTEEVKEGEEAPRKSFELKDSPLYYMKGKLTTKEQRDDLINYLLPLYDLYFKNYYMNSFFLNQLVSGDQAQYKDAATQIKRMSISFAQGQVGRVNKTSALRPTYKTMVMKDVKELISKDSVFGKRFPRLVEKAFEITDGQGYATKERMDNLRKGSGREANIGATIKPAYAGIDKAGIMRHVKYSVVELTDELCRAFPDLREVRRFMLFGEPNSHVEGEMLFNKMLDDKLSDPEKLRYNQIIEELYNDKDEQKHPIDEISFASAFKTGLPAKVSDMKDGKIKFESDSVVTLYNENDRQQLNPRHDADTRITHPSQMTYLTNTNGKNFEAQNNITSACATINTLGIESALNEIQDDSAIMEKISSTLGKVEGNERYIDFIDKLGKDSFNLPFLAKKFQQSLIAYLSKNSIEVKHKGAKLVLQSMWGTMRGKLQDKAEPRMVFTNKAGKEVGPDEAYSYHMECYLPKELYRTLVNQYKNRKLKDGRTITTAEAEAYILNNDVYTDILGYRIPSTELHSAVPLRIKGWYPNKQGENIIIAPKELVLLHGSDFDIDALYIMTPYTSSKTYKSLDKQTIVQKGVAIGYELSGGKVVPSSLIEKGKSFLDWIADEIDRYKGTEGTDEYIAELMDIAKKAASNTILDNFMKTIKANRNIDDMLAPISMAVFNDFGDADSVFRYFAKLLSTEENPEPKREDFTSDEDYGDAIETWVKDALYTTRDLNREDHQAQIHRDNFAGSALTGAFANAFKIISYIFMSTNNFNVTGNVKEEDQPLPILKEEYHQEFDGVKYTTFNRYVLDENGLRDGKEGRPRMTIWEGLDALINAAIDNVKEQILSVINATEKTNNVMSAMIAYGIPMTKISVFMRQPAVMEIAKRSRDREGVNNVQRDLVGELRKRTTTDPRTNEEYVGEYEITPLDKQIIENAQQQILLNNTLLEGELTEKQIERINKDIQKQQHRIDVISGVKKTTADDLTNILKSVEASISTKEMDKAFLLDFANLDTFSTDDIVFQLQVIDKFKQLNTVGSGYLTTGAIGLSILRQIPGSYVDIETALENLSSFFDKETKEIAESIPFTNVKLLGVPNIRSAVSVVEKTKDKLSSTFSVLNPNFINFAKEMRIRVLDTRVSKASDVEGENVLGFNAGTPLDQGVDINEVTAGNRSFTDYNQFEDESNIRTSFGEYIMSGTVVKDANGDTYEFSTEDEPPYQRVIERRDNKYTEEIYGTAAWTQRFLMEGLPSSVYEDKKMLSLMELKKLYGDTGDNAFLRQLEIVRDYQTNGYYLTFNASNKALEDTEILALEQAFTELKYLPIYDRGDGKPDKKIKNDEEAEFNELQYMILKYDVLERGSSFASNNYSLYMDPSIYKGVARHLTKNLDALFAAPGTKSLEQLKDHFLLQVTLQNVANLPKIDAKKDGSKPMVGTLLVGEDPEWKLTPLEDLIDGLSEEEADALTEKVLNQDEALDHNKVAIYFDAVVEEIDRPPVFAKIGSTAYRRVNVIKSQSGKKYAFYQKIDRLTSAKNYQFSRKLLKEGYSIAENFNPAKLYLPIAFREGDTFISDDPKATFLEKDTIFEAYSASDYSRRTSTTVAVVSIKEQEIDGKNKFVITTRPATEEEIDAKAKVVEQNQMADIEDESKQCKEG